MNRHTRHLKDFWMILLCSVLVSGCQTFRPRGYQPPKDSHEYVMKRDRDASQQDQECRDPWLAKLIADLLNWAAHSSR